LSRGWRFGVDSAKSTVCMDARVFENCKLTL
jgi:hypothetical protein